MKGRAWGGMAGIPIINLLTSGYLEAMRAGLGGGNKQGMRQAVVGCGVWAYAPRAAAGVGEAARQHLSARWRVARQAPDMNNKLLSKTGRESGNLDRATDVGGC